MLSATRASAASCLLAAWKQKPPGDIVHRASPDAQLKLLVLSFPLRLHVPEDIFFFFFFARHDWSKLQWSLEPCQHLNGHLSENACSLCIWWKESFPNDRRWASNQRQLSSKYLFPPRSPLNQLLLQSKAPMNENLLDKRGISRFNKVSLTKVSCDLYLLLLG